MKRILVHICCGPCALYPVKKVLDGKKYSVTGFFYNPNIHPIDEFRKRLDAAKTLAKLMNLDVKFHEDYDPAEYFAEMPEDRPGKDLRCPPCYRIRLEKTAAAAKQNGFDFFSTSLLYSKFQNHELITETGLDIAGKYGIPFYYEDFRAGWKEGVNESRSLGLYRQNYCGCIFSRAERQA